jgi:hypothetical protein
MHDKVMTKITRAARIVGMLDVAIGYSAGRVPSDQRGIG